MTKKRGIIFPVFLIVISGIIAVIGYNVNGNSSPVRVLFKTKGGPVIFTHKAHIEGYADDCSQCHHSGETGEEPDSWRCRSCHIQGSPYDSICEDQAPHKQCIGANCTTCHEAYGMDPGECGFCHRP
jgi:hypothetical protein